jgi:SAM-dependent methyltransferase
MDPFLYDEFYRIERTHWWAVGMRGIFHMLLREALAGRERPRILDVGCGTGITLEEFGRYGSIAGIDLAWQALAYTRRRVSSARLVQADLASLPIGTSCVDAVLAFDVIEHLDDDRGALEEIRRILRPGGVALINVPAFASLWSGKDEANHHKRRYRRSALRRSLVAAGFTVDRITYTNAALFPAIWCARQVQRLARTSWNSQAEYHPSARLNAALLRLLDAERRLLRHIDLPCGTSVTCLARRGG